MPDRELCILDRGLCKWPQMVVTGDPVTIEQAKEIIRRTDKFFASPEWAGNNPGFRDWVIKTIGCPKEEEWDAQQEWLARWGYISTEYVVNRWICCAFILGPHGWCNPDGKILFTDNIGKWPTGEAVLSDWSAIAKTFPFLNLQAVIADREAGEDGDAVPVIGIRVSGGEAVAFDPKIEDCPPTFGRDIDFYARATRCMVGGMETGIPTEWIEEWGDAARKQQT